LFIAGLFSTPDLLNLLAKGESLHSTIGLFVVLAKQLHTLDFKQSTMWAAIAEDWCGKATSQIRNQNVLSD